MSCTVIPLFLKHYSIICSRLTTYFYAGVHGIHICYIFIRTVLDDASRVRASNVKGVLIAFYNPVLLPQNFKIIGVYSEM